MKKGNKKVTSLKRKTTRPDEKPSRLNHFKDKKKLEEFKVLKALQSGEAKTMRQIEFETGVRVNIQCWAFKHSKESNKSIISHFGKCPISGAKKVQFHTLTILGRYFVMNYGRAKK